MSQKHKIPRNFIWQSLTGEHKHLALGTGKARRYLPEVSPFASLLENTSECLKDLAKVVPIGDMVILRDELPDHDGEWVIEQRNESVQFVYPPSHKASLQSGIQELTPENLPAMIELINLVLPGYFKKESMQMGKFFGIFDGDRLVAMTGERVFAWPFKEITAVGTHPDYQGKGFAARLVEHVAARMQAEGLIPFLHTHTTNTPAIKLYQKLGFDVNGEFPLIRIRRV